MRMNQGPQGPSISCPIDMRHWLAKAGVVAAALTLALLSSNIERRGPELASFGNLCGPSGDAPCLKPVLKGGFPMAYLFDAPGVSVQGRLSFGEDELRPVPLVIDMIAYALVFLLISRAAARRRSARPRATAAET